MDRRYGQDYGYGQCYVNGDGQVLWFMVNGYGYGYGQWLWLWLSLWLGVIVEHYSYGQGYVYSHG